MSDAPKADDGAAVEADGDADRVRLVVVFVVLKSLLACELVGQGLRSTYYKTGSMRRTGSRILARRPCLIAGFAGAAAIGLIPFVRQDDRIAMSCIAAAGIGIQMIVNVIVLDLAPLAGIGTMVGLVTLAGTCVRFVVNQVAVALEGWTHSVKPILMVGSGLAVLGVVATGALLREIVPMEESEQDIPNLFS